MTTVVLRRVFFVQLSFRRPKAFHQTVRLPKDMLCSFEPETVQICHPLCSALSKTFNWSFIVLLQKFWFFKITWTKKKRTKKKTNLVWQLGIVEKFYRPSILLQKTLTTHPFFLISYIVFWVGRSIKTTCKSKT